MAKVVYMNVGDFLTVETEWTVPFASNPCVNVWHFKCDAAATPGSLAFNGADVVESFIGRFVTPLLSYQASNLRLTGVKLRDITDPTDGYDAGGILAAGAAVSINLPPFVTFSIREQRYNLSTRSGRKALPGATVSSVADGGVVAPAVVTAMNTLMSDWAGGAWLVEGPDWIFQTVILRLSPTPGMPPTVVNSISNMYVSSNFGSQNSRKA
jgi:hypothetical protein